MKIEIGKANGISVSYCEECTDNGHMVITGSSGAGKTVQIQRIIKSIVNQGGSVVALDIHGIFAEEQIFALFQKFFLEESNSLDVYESGLVYPLFEPMVFADGTHEHEEDVIDAVANLFSESFHFGVRQKSVLRGAVRAVCENTHLYETRGIGVLHDILTAEDNPKADEVADRISQITGNNVFRHGDGFIMWERLNVIRLSKFAIDAQKIIAEMIIALIWRMAIRDAFKNHNLYLVIDECQNLDFGKRSILNHVLAEGRKYGLRLILSTQILPRDAMVVKQMMQAGMIMFFRPPLNELRYVSELIDSENPKTWFPILRELGVGEFIVSTPVLLENGAITKKPLKVSARM